VRNAANVSTPCQPEYPLNARDKLLDTIAKDVDRTQPRIPFFRRPIDPLQVWSAPNPTSDPGNPPSDGQSDVADALFDRLMLVQRVVRFGSSAPPPMPHTPEIRVMEVAPAEDGDAASGHNGNGDAHPDKDAEAEGESNASIADAKSSSQDTDSDDEQPLAFKAGGRSSLGLTPNILSPNRSPQLQPHKPHGRPPHLQLNGHPDERDASIEMKTHAHILLRILYVYSLLHPHHPYTQGLNELLAPLYYTVFEGRTSGLRSYSFSVQREELVGEAAVRAAGEVVAKADGEPSSNDPLTRSTSDDDEEDDPTQHIEADTFWLFVELMGELGSVVGDPGDWSLPPISSGSGEGVRGVMVRLSDRLRWADARLWEDMVSL
jgi:hypothetical protein